jgi:hypothetical protein
MVGTAAAWAILGVEIADTTVTLFSFADVNKEVRFLLRA